MGARVLYASLGNSLILDVGSNGWKGRIMGVVEEVQGLSCTVVSTGEAVAVPGRNLGPRRSF